MNRALRLSILFCLFGTLGCTRAPRWIAGEWLGQGKPSLPSSVSKPIFKTAFKSGQLEFLAQEVAGVTVDGSFAKIVVSRHSKVPETGRPSSWARFRYVEPKDLPHPKTVKRSLERGTSSLKIAKGSFPKPWCKTLDTSLARAKPALTWINSAWQVVFKGSCEDHRGHAYEFTISDQGALIGYERTGSSFTDNTNAVEVSATLYPKGPKESSLSTLKLILSKQPTYLFNPLLNIVSDAGTKIVDLSQVPEIKPLDPRFDLLQVYFYSSNAIIWMTKIFAYQPENLKIRTHVGHPEDTNTAFYFQREVRLGTGDGKIFSRLSWDPSIVTHEVMHSVVDSLVRLPFKGEGGSVNEALCDLLTAYLLGNPRMGESSYKSRPYQRTLENTATLGQRGGGLYADSLILSGTVWQIGQETSRELGLSLIEHLLAYLVPSSGFDDAKTLLQTWYSELPSGPHHDRVEGILTQRGWL